MGSYQALADERSSPPIGTARSHRHIRTHLRKMPHEKQHSVSTHVGGFLVLDAHAVQHHVSSLDRIAHRVHRRSLHVRHVEPGDVAALDQRLVDPLHRGLCIPLV